MHLLLNLPLIFCCSSTTCRGFDLQLVETATRARGSLKLRAYAKTSNVRVNTPIGFNNGDHRHYVNNDRSSAVAVSHYRSTTTVSILFSNQNDDDGPEKEDEENVARNKSSDGISLLSSYAIQFLGVALSLGLLLNVCGFGYMLDLERGLRINRVENLRREYQFQKAQKEIERAPSSKRPNLSLENSADNLPK